MGYVYGEYDEATNTGKGAAVLRVSSNGKYRRVVCVWNGNLLMVKDLDSQETLFNGLVSNHFSKIQDVIAAYTWIVVVGEVQGIAGCAYGYARLNVDTWRIDPAGAVYGR